MNANARFSLPGSREPISTSVNPALLTGGSACTSACFTAVSSETGRLAKKASRLYANACFAKFCNGQFALFPRFSSLSGCLPRLALAGFRPASCRVFFGGGAAGCAAGLRSVMNGSYTRRMLWIKAFHIVFVASWFAGLFYLPRIFVNLAMVPAGSEAERARLLLMARKLLRFSTGLGTVAVVLGLWLYLVYGIGRHAGWMHAKLFVVLLVIGYHHACAALLRKFEQGRNARSHRWYRWFNEIPVLLLTIVVVLVVVKPF